MYAHPDTKIGALAAMQYYVYSRSAAFCLWSYMQFSLQTKVVVTSLVLVDRWGN